MKGAIESLQDGKWLSSTAIEFSLNACCPAEARVFDASFVNLQAPEEMFAKHRLRLRNEHIWVVPLNHNDNHWTLAIVDFRASVIEHYDTQHVGVCDRLEALENLIKSLSAREDTVVKPFWAWESRALLGPSQSNNFDCGIYIIIVAYHRLLRLSVPLVVDLVLWRRVLRSLLNDAIDGSSQPAELREADFCQDQGQLDEDDLDDIETRFNIQRKELEAARASKQLAEGTMTTITAFTSLNRKLYLQAEEDRRLSEESLNEHRNILATYYRLDRILQDVVDSLQSAIRSTDLDYQRFTSQVDNYLKYIARWGTCANVLRGGGYA